MEECEKSQEQSRVLLTEKQPRPRRNTRRSQSDRDIMRRSSSARKHLDVQKPRSLRAIIGERCIELRLDKRNSVLDMLEYVAKELKRYRMENQNQN